MQARGNYVCCPMMEELSDSRWTEIVGHRNAELDGVFTQKRDTKAVGSHAESNHKANLLQQI